MAELRKDKQCETGMSRRKTERKRKEHKYIGEKHITAFFSPSPFS